MQLKKIGSKCRSTSSWFRGMELAGLMAVLCCDESKLRHHLESNRHRDVGNAAGLNIGVPANWS
jgi:hypothetical protein